MILVPVGQCGRSEGDVLLSGQSMFEQAVSSFSKLLAGCN
jgi:hypothetical protein